MREGDSQISENYDDINGDKPSMPQIDDAEHDAFDQYMQSEVFLPQGGILTLAKVKRRKRDLDGNLMGTLNPNPISDTNVYELKCVDSEIMEYEANIVTENIYTEIDEEDYHRYQLKEIIDHRTDGSHIIIGENGTTIINGKECPRRTTLGWELCLSLADESTIWTKLKDIKVSHQV